MAATSSNSAVLDDAHPVRGGAVTRVKAAGVQPVAVDGDDVYFLLGRENYEEGWRDSGKWASFAGRREPGESVLECAVREGYEESMGFLGSRAAIRRGVTKKGMGYVDHLSMRTYLYRIEYRPDLPALFADIVEYMRDCKCPHGKMEKGELRWFHVSELAQLVYEHDPSIRFTLTSAFVKMIVELKRNL